MTGPTSPYTPWVPRQTYLIQHQVCTTARCLHLDPRPVTGNVCPRCGAVPAPAPSEYARDRRAV